MIELGIYLTALISFSMITADVIGLKFWYDKLAEKEDFKSSCDWCFSFHLSWIFNSIYLIICIYFDSFDYPENGLLLIPITTLISFIIYRKSA